MSGVVLNKIVYEDLQQTNLAQNVKLPKSNPSEETQESWLYWLASKTTGVFWAIFTSAPTYVNLEDDGEQKATNSASSSVTKPKLQRTGGTINPDIKEKLESIMGATPPSQTNGDAKRPTRPVSRGTPPPPPPPPLTRSTSTNASSGTSTPESKDSSPSIQDRPKLSFLAEIKGLGDDTALTASARLKKAANSKKETSINGLVSKTTGIFGALFTSALTYVNLENDRDQKATSSASSSVTEPMPQRPAVEVQLKQEDKHLGLLQNAVAGRKALSEAKIGSHLNAKQTASTTATTASSSLSHSSGTVAKPLVRSTSDLKAAKQAGDNQSTGRSTHVLTQAATLTSSSLSQSSGSVSQPADSTKTASNAPTNEVKPVSGSTKNDGDTSTTATTVTTLPPVRSQSSSTGPQPADSTKTASNSSTREGKPVSGSSTNGGLTSTTVTTVTTKETLTSTRSQPPSSTPQPVSTKTASNTSTNEVKRDIESSTNGGNTLTTVTTVTTLAPVRSQSSGSGPQPADSTKTASNASTSEVKTLSGSSTNGGHTSTTATTVSTLKPVHSQSPGSGPQPAESTKTPSNASTSAVKPGSGSSTNGALNSTTAATVATSKSLTSVPSQSPGSGPQPADSTKIASNASTSEVKRDSGSSTNGGHTSTPATTGTASETLTSTRSQPSSSAPQPAGSTKTPSNASTSEVKTLSGSSTNGGHTSTPATTGTASETLTSTRSQPSSSAPQPAQLAQSPPTIARKENISSSSASSTSDSVATAASSSTSSNLVQTAFLPKQMPIGDSDQLLIGFFIDYFILRIELQHKQLEDALAIKGKPFTSQEMQTHNELIRNLKETLGQIKLVISDIQSGILSDRIKEMPIEHRNGAREFVTTKVAEYLSKNKDIVISNNYENPILKFLFSPVSELEVTRQAGSRQSTSRSTPVLSTIEAVTTLTSVRSQSSSTGPQPADSTKTPSNSSTREGKPVSGSSTNGGLTSTTATTVSTLKPVHSQSPGSGPQPADSTKATLNKSTSEVKTASGSSTNGGLTSTAATTVTTLKTVHSQSPSSAPQPPDSTKTASNSSTSEVKRESGSSTNGGLTSTAATTVTTLKPVHSQSPSSAPQPPDSTKTAPNAPTNEVKPGSGSSTNGNNTSTIATTVTTLAPVLSQSPSSGPQPTDSTKATLNKSTSEVKRESGSSTNGSHSSPIATTGPTFEKPSSSSASSTSDSFATAASSSTSSIPVQTAVPPKQMPNGKRDKMVFDFFKEYFKSEMERNIEVIGDITQKLEQFVDIWPDYLIKDYKKIRQEQQDEMDQHAQIYNDIITESLTNTIREMSIKQRNGARDFVTKKLKEYLSKNKGIAISNDYGIPVLNFLMSPPSDLQETKQTGSRQSARINTPVSTQPTASTSSLSSSSSASRALPKSTSKGTTGSNQSAGISSVSSPTGAVTAVATGQLQLTSSVSTHKPIAPTSAKLLIAAANKK